MRSQQVKFQLHLKIWGIGSLLFVGLLGVAQGQDEPLAIGNTNAVFDVLGRPFPGTWSGDVNDAARVEVREYGTGIAAPDPITGEGNDTVNPLLLVTYMGHDIVSSTDTGMFSYSLPDRLPKDVVYFARVYDAAQPSASYYYANSLPFHDVPPEQQSTTPNLDIKFQGLHLWDTNLPAGDTDGDGIPDWMEPELYSTDPTLSDTDEDGYNDKFEVLHSEYVDPTEKNPNEIQLYLPDFSEPPSETNEYYVRWWAIPDVDYRLEYGDTMIDGQAYSNIWSGSTSETNLEISVEWVQTNAGVKGFFRYMIP